MRSWRRKSCAGFDSGVELTSAGTVLDPQHTDAVRAFWWEATWIGEVEIECDEDPFVAGCRLDNGWNRRAGVAFVVNGVDVVSSRSKLVGPAVAEVLVELQPHPTSTKLPALKRAP